LGGEVRVDWSEEADELDRATAPGRSSDGDRDVNGGGPEREQFHSVERSVPLERELAHRTTVDAVYRRHVIDQGCDRVEKLEREIVSPAMRRIEVEDPDRSLVGFEHRLKGKDRLAEKVEFDIGKWGVSAETAFTNVKDAIRYTLEYPEEKYARGVPADVDRIKAEGFELVELRNSWGNEEYKGTNSRWRLAENSQLFEVQFHTHASFEAKQETHAAYERLRTLPDDHEDVHELRSFQREVTAKIPVPPGASDIPDYP
jgi:hypothetical protein